MRFVFASFTTDLRTFLFEHYYRSPLFALFLSPETVGFRVSHLKTKPQFSQKILSVVFSPEKLVFSFFPLCRFVRRKCIRTIWVLAFIVFVGRGSRVCWKCSVVLPNYRKRRPLITVGRDFVNCTSHLILQYINTPFYRLCLSPGKNVPATLARWPPLLLASTPPPA